MVAVPRKSQLLHIYNKLVADGVLEPQPQLKKALVKKQSKSQSGVLVITVSFWRAQREREREGG